MSQPQGLEGLYLSILEFIPKHCSILKEVTLGSRSRSVMKAVVFFSCGVRYV